MTKRIFCTLYFLLPFLVAAQKVLSIKVDGSINPASAAFIQSAIKKAGQENAECLVIHLNTPGGLLKSTRAIVSDILESSVPVVVFVSPGGAHAGSAGVFITMAAHVAAMAPSTNIGAAHPVNMQGGMDSTMNDKTTNDAAAFIRAIAEKRNRNLEWAEEAVRQSVAITEREAVANRVVDLVAQNEADLLTRINGRQVEVNGSTRVLRTGNAEVVKVEMTFAERLLDLISDPNIAYILMMIGFYGILFELYSPGAIAPGVIGAISLILAFYSLHTLPLNYAGLALIVVGIILFILEINIVSHGVLSIGGVIALALGSMMLIKTESGLEFMRISTSVIIATAVVSFLFFVFIVGMAVKAQKAKPVTGMEGLVGKEGTALDRLEPGGMIRVQGELWKAEAPGSVIDAGKKVRVKGIRNLTLIVEPIEV